MTAHILIVEDEPSIADTLLFVLQNEGFRATWKSLAGEALDLLQSTAVDLVIMDVGLPDITGFEACKQLRKFSNVPVIFLTARGDELDRVVGLEIGADDYVVKPFSPREVAARVKAILKRVAPINTHPKNPQISANTSQLGEFKIDSDRLQIFYRQQLLQLTRIEFKLLQTLIEQPRKVFSRDQLLAAVGTAVEAGYDRSIDTHIKTLRAKLRQIAADAEPIQTQRGFGYCYQPESL
ncbi:DNA-binding response regulator [Cellvibrio zantedeschiae]|uniref:DNA-binding response regulator n=1 Tax=Cellvibrio zantedeschiae TaxID=1237077 RepID=A0ABQ3ARB2_9GAMM|nr:two-component system response regulator CreB [Cellvibrio zantedeschiae]GGY64200.1 DNA-binding response regulator [Cellvibrio zantedeschiae]